jgi:hypothetical protein
MVGLAFGVAACGQLPGADPVHVLEGFDHPRRAVGRLRRPGFSSVLFVLFSKSVWVDVLGKAAALFPYTQPALFAMPVAFLLAYIFSKTDSSARRSLRQQSLNAAVNKKPWPNFPPGFFYVRKKWCIFRGKPPALPILMPANLSTVLVRPVSAGRHFLRPVIRAATSL